MNENADGRIPLGLCKQAFMKLSSALVDIHEIKEDDDLDEDEKHIFGQIADNLAISIAHITNIVTKEIDEEDFLNENIDMDPIDEYPEKDIMDMNIG